MWLYVVGFVLMLFGLVGSLAGGGIFTIALLPIGFVILASAFGYSLFTRAETGATGGETDAHPTTNQPLPHTPRQDSGRVPTSPERLADARRVEQ